MRAIVVGMGVQGNKRKNFLGKDFVYSVDKFKKADFQSISKVPLNKFDTVFACVPDSQKLKIVNYCINNKKHILLEKPFIVKNNKILSDLEKRARNKKVVCYTAYNHRFEPHFIRMKRLIPILTLVLMINCGTQTNV